MAYVPGDYWAIDPITGGKFRISEFVQAPTKDNANTGDWVYKGAVDPVHPQEYVTGVEDDPSVAVALPGVVAAMGETTLQNNVVVNEQLLFFVSLTVTEGDPIGVTMNNGATFWSYAEEVETLTGTPLVDSDSNLVLDGNGDVVTAADPYHGYLVTLNTPIHGSADMGNAVLLPALDNEEWQ